jgi:hypothetical protein
MKKSHITQAIVALTLLTSSAALATTTSETQVDLSNRSEKKIGAYLGILGDPHPSIVGFNVAYNALDFMRVSVGYGQITESSLSFTNQGLTTTESKMTTIGTAVKAFVPGWNLTPTAGLGYSHVSVSNNLSFAKDYKSNNLYFNIGGDWQAASGLNAGIGLNVSINGAAPTAPYLNLGYFFM